MCKEKQNRQSQTYARIHSVVEIKLSLSAKSSKIIQPSNPLEQEHEDSDEHDCARDVATAVAATPGFRLGALVSMGDDDGGGNAGCGSGRGAVGVCVSWGRDVDGGGVDDGWSVGDGDNLCVSACGAGRSRCYFACDVGGSTGG